MHISVVWHSSALRSFALFTWITLTSIHSFSLTLRGIGGVRIIGFCDGVPSVTSCTAVGVNEA